MAARRPTATPGPRPQLPFRTAYDEFDPQSEWKDEPAANVLNVYLPEFVKNQIKVRFDRSTNTLNVSAERPSGDNRIARVNKDYKIPGNSNVSNMQGKLDDETLTITIAKEIASKVDPKLPKADKTAQEPSGTQKRTDEKIPTPPRGPYPPLDEQKSEEKPAKVPAGGKDLPDPSARKETTKTKLIKDEDEEETQVPPPSSPRKPRDEKFPTKFPTPPAVPSPSANKQKSEEKPARVPSLLPDPWREMEEGRDFPDPSILKGKTKAMVQKVEDEDEDEDESEDETHVPPPSSTQKPRDEKIPTPPAAPLPPLGKQKSEEKQARIPSLLPDPWHEMEEGRDFPDPSVIKGKTPGLSTALAETKKPTGDRKSAKPDDDDKEIASKWKESARLKDRFAQESKEPTPEEKSSSKGKKPGGRKDSFSEQEMEMSNDIPEGEELEMKAKKGPTGEEIDIYAAARKAMLDLTMRIKEDRQLVINIGVAALVIVALGSYVSYTIGLSGGGDKN